MIRFLLVLVVALGIAAPAASADGPPLYASQGGAGLLSADGAYRYVAVGTGNLTMLEKIATRGGSVAASVPLLGSYGIPLVTYDRAGGLSADGRTLVLGDAGSAYPHTRSAFALVDARSLNVRDVVSLGGDFAFDAVSPDGRLLYLIEHADQLHYLVRAYDTARHRLLPGRIADREQKRWLMQGYPVDRVASAGGRFVYTLYDNPGGYPFVHALDTVRATARCVGLPLRGNAAYNLRLALRDGGKRLAVRWQSGRRWLVADTATWRLSPDRAGGFPWWTLAFLAPLPLPLLRYARRR